MATCCPWKITTWLTYSQQGGVQVQILRGWEYRGKADECHKHAHPQPQRYLCSQLQLLSTGGRYLCSQKWVPRHSIMDQRALVCSALAQWTWLKEHRHTEWFWVAASPQCWVPEGHPWLQVSWQGCPARCWHAVGLLRLSTCSSSPEGFGWPIRWWYAGEKAEWEGWGLFIPWQAQDEERGLYPGGKTVWFERETEKLYGKSGKK